jgi:hypothetical protein
MNMLVHTYKYLLLTMLVAGVRMRSAARTIITRDPQALRTVGYDLPVGTRIITRAYVQTVVYRYV